jgi:hypothetical protein
MDKIKAAAAATGTQARRREGRYRRRAAGLAAGFSAEIRSMTSGAIGEIGRIPDNPSSTMDTNRASSASARTHSGQSGSIGSPLWSAARVRSRRGQVMRSPPVP